MSSHVYVDFDGTIMLCDTTDVLFERFALPEWRAVEDEWVAGRIGSRECMARQVDLLRATPDEIADAVAGLDIDPGFPDFLDACAEAGIGATIVSDGLDRVIAATLERHGLDVPYFANHLVWLGRNRWRLEFPHARATCVTRAGHCKCARTEARPGHMAIVVGDGRSDFCIAGRADLVLARDKLLDECRASGTPHLPFRGFDEATELLTRWLRAGANQRHRAAPLPLEA